MHDSAASDDPPYQLIPALLLALWFGWAMWKGRGLERVLVAHLASKGFVREEPAPVLSIGDLKFESGSAYRGAFAPGVSGVLVAGRGSGVRLTSTATTTFEGRFWYVCAVLPAAVALDDSWLERWQGDSRALRLPDGRTVVYSQRWDTQSNVDRILEELSASLVGREEEASEGS